MNSVHILVSGKVQGVFFRAAITVCAKELGIVGFVRNLPDGKVEIQAQGTDIERFLVCVNKGSAGSRVDNVKVEAAEQKGFDGFEIR